MAPFFHNMRFRHFIFSFAPMLAILIVCSILFYSMVYPNRLQLLTDRERHDVENAKKLIKNDLNLVITDLLDLYAHEGLHEFAKSKSDISRQSVIDGFSSFVRHKKSYDQVRFLDLNGIELIRINKGSKHPVVVADNELQDKSGRYYFHDTMVLPPKKILISPLDLNIENKQIEKPFKPMIRFSTPFHTGQQQRLQGMLIINFLGSSMLNKFVDHTSESTPLELLNGQGYWLKSNNPEQEWAFMFPENKQLSFANKYAEEWDAIRLGGGGQLRTDNGIFTYGMIDLATANFEPVISGIKANHWHLVTHLTNPILQSIRSELYQKIIFTDLLLLIFLTPGCVIYARIRGKVIRQVVLETANAELRQALEEIKTLRGTLPICANCKSIRNDEGYWNNIEKYLTENSEAGFSHGLCPPCMEELYGGQPWFEKKKDLLVKTYDTSPGEDDIS